MSDQEMSIEQQMAALQKKTKCPMAEGKLFVFVQAMDPYGTRRIVLECLAKRRVVKNPVEWKVGIDDIERLCCSPTFEKDCPWYKAAKKED